MANKGKPKFPTFFKNHKIHKKKMLETCVFPYLPFSDLRTMLIKKFEKIGGVSAKFHPNRSDFQFLVPAVFFFIISSPKETFIC